MLGRLQRIASTLQRTLADPVDVASIAVFRIVYGLCCLGLTLGFLTTDFLETWVSSCAVELHWRGLEWIALPCDLLWLRVLVTLAAVASAGVAFGAAFRWSAWLLVGLLAYALAADQAIYSSTYYLLVLLGFWLACSPADRAWSVDAWRRGRATGDLTQADAAASTGPAWPLRMLQFHVAVMYVYAAIAKLDADWLAGRPVAVWLGREEDLPLLGPWLQGETTALAFSWGGLFFDALVVPALLWRRTRVVALVVLVGFHAFNGLVLGVFPLPIVAVVGSLLLLPADWPRRLRGRTEISPRPHGVARPLSPRALGLLGAWMLVHLIVPLRHHAYPGSVTWNEDGDEFAWRLRARTKKRRLQVTVVDVATGERRKVAVGSVVAGVRDKAVRMYPDRLLQLVHHLAALEAAAGREVEVHVRYRVGLNGRPLRDLVDPKRDLAAQPRTFLNSSWIEPGP